jgi:transmembrane sensor
MTEASGHHLDDGVINAALAWLVRVQSDAATAEDWSALTRWLERSPSNLEAFEAVELLSAEIRQQAVAIAAAMSRPSAEIVPFPRRVAAAPRRRNPGVRAAMAAAAVGVSILAGFGGWRASEGTLQVYRTGTGETRSVTLADGSHVRLDAASTMKVRLGWFTRKVELGDAEAAFDVARNPNRPFEVAVGDQRVRVIGTEFNIRNYDGQTNVTVRRGIVAVYQPDLDPEPIARLTRGWQLRHRLGSAGSVQTQVDPNQAFAWTDGRLICDDRPLSEIVAYLNRRYPTQIAIPSSVAARRFTGVLELGDQQDVLRRLAGYLSLSIHRSEKDIILS